MCAPLPTSSWISMRHGTVGGRTQGTWYVSSTISLPTSDLLRVSPVQRTLRDVLKPTTQGHPLAVNKVSQLMTRKGFISGDCRVLPGQARVKVIAPSVFAPSGFVHRLLSSEELMDVYDVDEAVKSQLLHEPLAIKAHPLTTFVQQPSGKILHRLSLIAITAIQTSSQPWSSNTSSPPAVEDSAETDSSPSSVPHAISDHLPLPVDGVDGPDIKAVKHDDALANEHEWNERACSFLPGGYNPQRHQRACEVLRRCLFHRYKRNVLRSFTNYLGVTYGHDWSQLSHATIDASPTASRKRKRNDSSVRSLLASKEQLLKDLHVGHDAIYRAVHSSWWDWDAGSTLMFWKWPIEIRKDVRDGLKVWIENDLPNDWNRPRWPTDPIQKEQLRQKLFKPVRRRYLTRGFVKSLTSFFAVPKGLDDIRIVYDATACGLNDAIFAPNFYVPTIDSILRNASMSSYYGDINLGEMFLNYFLDEKIRKYTGVDVSEIADLIEGFEGISTQQKQRFIMRWERCMMGLKSSPFNATRTFAWSEDVIRGNPSDESNPLRWDSVVLNLPGSPDYKPWMPWVYRWDSKTGKMAAYFGSYIDDVRSVDEGEENCQLTTRRIACRINYLGQQDAPRKRRRVAQFPGAWSGAMVISKPDDGLYVTCSQEKWDKARAIIFNLLEHLENDPSAPIDRAKLQSERGFLIHIARTFPQLVPYLKGIHHTLESWHFGRNPEGWKLDTGGLMDWLAEEFDLEESEGVSSSTPTITKSNWKQLFQEYRERCEGDAPSHVLPVSRLLKDLEAMAQILSPKEPIHRFIRGQGIKRILLSFGDASGSGFGSSWETGDGTIHFRFGLWGDDMDKSSSNLRELQNLVDTLNKMHADGILHGVEIFLFTDNSVAEEAFFKGSSKSEKLHALVLELRLLEAKAGVKFHFVHVAGSRMIAQGSDGLSRGNMTEGVMGGEEMNTFVPLHLNAIQRSPAVKEWINDWLKLENDDVPIFLSPEDWFLRGHNIVGWVDNTDGIPVPRYRKGVMVWTPAPAAADVALEEMRKSRQKHMDSTHVFVCPRLMTPYWRRHLHRVADVIFEIPAGTSFWNHTMHEPLIIGLTFPFLKHRPWQLQKQPAVLEVERRLRRLWKKDPSSAGLVLRKLRINQRALANMPPKLASLVLQSSEGLTVSRRKTRKRRRGSVDQGGRFMCARKGDALSCPFQCDRCWFVNLKKEEPNPVSLVHQRLLGYIRRVNLDAMWSKESSTVRSTLDGMFKNFRRAADLGLEPQTTPRGPWPVGDGQGFQLALQILRQSQESGRHDETYQQFDSIRRLRSAAFNEFESGILLDGTPVFTDKGHLYRLSNDPTRSIFFEKFMRGLEKRMGRLVKQDKALDIRILLLIIKNLEGEIKETRTSPDRKRFLSVFIAYLCVTYSGALRGGEGFLMEATSLCQMIDEGKHHEEIPHVLAPLLGRFKNEVGEVKMLFALASVTASGIPNRRCLERLVNILTSEGKHLKTGPAICDQSGACLTRKICNLEFHRALGTIQLSHPDLIAADVQVREIYNIHRSLRRGATTRASAAGVSEADVNLNNRWGKTENNRGRRPHFKMSELYVDIKQALNAFLRFSLAL